MTLVGMGVVVHEVLSAADKLAAAGLQADVVCLTSADLCSGRLQARRGLGDGDTAILDELFPPDRAAPLVAVLDSHPHTLSFLSSVRSVRTSCLGVSDFGQSGDVDDLYSYFGIDADTIVGAALDLIHIERANGM